MPPPAEITAPIPVPTRTRVVEGSWLNISGNRFRAWLATTATRVRTRLSPWHILVAIAVVGNALLLLPELTYVQPLNDATLHMSMVRWAADQSAQGHLPLDGWFPNFSLGTSQFHHYQSLPAVLTGLIAGPLGPNTTYLFIQYLLLTFWPVVIYAAARMLDRDIAEACIAALIAPLLSSITSYGYEQGSYTWQGLGVWTQLWGMWLLPLAWGFTWRAIEGRGRCFWAGLFIALTIASHFLTAYLALLAIPVMLVCRPGDWRPRLGRCIAIGGGALLMASWVLVPLVGDQAYAASSDSFRTSSIVVGSFTSAPGAWYDSFGISKVLEWLVKGQLYDGGHPNSINLDGSHADDYRVPIVTVVVAIGMLVAALRWRRDTSARALLFLWLGSLILFIGPATLPMLRWLPGGNDVFFHRFIIGVHLTGIFMAGIAGAWVVRWCAAWVLSVVDGVDLRPLLVLPAALVLFSPVWGLVGYSAYGATLIHQQQAAEATFEPDLDVLMADARTLGGGRVWATQLNSSSPLRLGRVPLFDILANHDVDQIGLFLRTLSLSTDPETLFDPTVNGPVGQAQYTLFNIRFVIQEASNTSPARFGWTRVGVSGSFALWQVGPGGYVRVVDTFAPPIVADRTTLGSAAGVLMRSPDLAAGRFHPVAFNGAQAAPPSMTTELAPATAAGTVTREQDTLNNGLVQVSLTANRPAVALLSVTYDPRWTATVDGQPVTPHMIAPSLVGVAVPAGDHSVVFRYAPYSLYWLWFLIAVATGAALSRPRWLRRVTSPLQPAFRRVELLFGAPRKA